eukprot:NODE_2175_length_971_cov_178.219089_g1788_i0.p2 GENE.NODE_2175_length_971_cov_178.219089_g1788_i0~~NODE_2175_length_971_cov_178.219089_g1788_i0.p2  ORF type:complete len:86 (-),score=11.06 NODE_2175_length_971_cov_178.219089_g1788_i0:427-684(-)
MSSIVLLFNALICPPLQAIRDAPDSIAKSDHLLHATLKRLEGSNFWAAQEKCRVSHTNQTLHLSHALREAYVGMPPPTRRDLNCK